jgi:hypothetical protein
MGLQDAAWDDLSEKTFARCLYDQKRDGSLVAKQNTVAKTWRSMVWEYTTLDLTCVSDRLAAIQGCSEKIQQVFGMHYMQGLWRESFVSDMLWHKSIDGFFIPRLRRHPGLFNHPTWSWASVHRPVKFREATKISAQFLLAEHKADNSGCIRL